MKKMFSNNHKITARQVQALLLTDWTGKIMLILPALVGGLGGRNAVAGALAGLALAVAAGVLIVGTGGNKEAKGKESYLAALEKRIGYVGAVTVRLLYGVYFLYHTALMLYLCGETAVTCLLPETEFWQVTLVAVLLGCYLAWGGLEVRGRVSELTAFVIWGLFFLMLLFSMSSLEPSQLAMSGGSLEIEPSLSCAGSVLLGFGVLGALPLIRDQVEDGEHLPGSIRKAVALTGVLLLMVLLSGFGIFGAAGMERLRWPVIALMSSGRLQGIFLQRWDVLLLGLLVFGLFMSVGCGIYYLGVAADGYRSGRRGWLAAGAAASWLLCLWMRQSHPVLLWGSRIAFWGCTPILFLIAVWLRLREKLEQRRMVSGHHTGKEQDEREERQ